MRAHAWLLGLYLTLVAAQSSSQPPTVSVVEPSFSHNTMDGIEVLLRSIDISEEKASSLRKETWDVSQWQSVQEWKGHFACLIAGLALDSESVDTPPLNRTVVDGHWYLCLTLFHIICG